jgi:hypothetical protein
VHAAGRALAAAMRRLLGALAAGEINTVIARFVDDWPTRLPPRTGTTATLPVLRWLPSLAAASNGGAAAAGSAAANCADVAEKLIRTASDLTWQQTYTRRDLDEAFLDNYGWTELFGLRGPLVSERLSGGFLLLGPHTLYPRHRHEAEEFYVPLSGTAAWQQGDGIWREKIVGSPIHHASFEPHAMHTADQPLLALYLWRGAQLTGSARLDD